MITRFERFSFAIAELSRYWHKIAADEMAKYGLKGSHALYLTTIHRYPNGITAAQLCELCSKDKSDVSRTMSTLIKRGMVCKLGGHTQRYRALLILTEEGKAAAEQIQKAAMIAVEKAGQGISDENRAIFYETLKTIAENLEKLADKGLPRRGRSTPVSISDIDDESDDDEIDNDEADDEDGDEKDI